MNPFQMVGQLQNMMKNPLGMLQKQMLQKLQNQNPQQFNQIQKMLEGKNDEQLRNMAENIANERGINLSEFANQFGIKL